MTLLATVVIYKYYYTLYRFMWETDKKQRIHNSLGRKSFSNTAFLMYHRHAYYFIKNEKKIDITEKTIKTFMLITLKILLLFVKFK